MTRTTIQKIAPNKLNIRTLLEVFNAFWSSGGPLQTLLGQSQVEAFYFRYDNKQWKATIRQQVSEYKHPDWNEYRVIQFINIKLPNDSYLYSSKYQQNSNSYYPSPRYDDSDLCSVLGAIISQLRVIDDKIFSPKNLEVKYWKDDGRFDLYFWDTNGGRCYTIKFEYGSCTDVYNNEELRSDKSSRRKAFEEIEEKLEKRVYDAEFLELKIDFPLMEDESLWV